MTNMFLSSLCHTLISRPLANEARHDVLFPFLNAPRATGREESQIGELVDKLRARCSKHWHKLPRERAAAVIKLGDNVG